MSKEDLQIASYDALAYVLVYISEQATPMSAKQLIVVYLMERVIKSEILHAPAAWTFCEHNKYLTLLSIGWLRHELVGFYNRKASINRLLSALTVFATRGDVKMVVVLKSTSSWASFSSHWINCYC